MSNKGEKGLKLHEIIKKTISFYIKHPKAIFMSTRKRIKFVDGLKYKDIDSGEKVMKRVMAELEEARNVELDEVIKGSGFWNFDYGDKVYIKFNNKIHGFCPSCKEITDDPNEECPECKREIYNITYLGEHLNQDFILKTLKLIRENMVNTLLFGRISKINKMIEILKTKGGTAYFTFNSSNFTRTIDIYYTEPIIKFKGRVYKRQNKKISINDDYEINDIILSTHKY